MPRASSSGDWYRGASFGGSTPVLAVHLHVDDLSRGGVDFPIVRCFLHEKFFIWQQERGLRGKPQSPVLMNICYKY